MLPLPCSFPRDTDNRASAPGETSRLFQLPFILLLMRKLRARAHRARLGGPST